MNVAIIGAGDMTANVVELFDVDFKFIFDKPLHPGETKFGLPITDTMYITHDLKWISSVGEDTRHKRELIQRAMDLPDGPSREDFINLIHPQARIARNATMGLGVYMQPFSTVYAEAYVGDHVLICGACNIGHHAKVHDYCSLGHQVFIGGHVMINEGVFLGSGCKIKPGREIGEGAFVGMGAVVTKDVPPNEIWVGNPARPMRDRALQPGPRKHSPKKLLEAWR